MVVSIEDGGDCTSGIRGPNRVGVRPRPTSGPNHSVSDDRQEELHANYNDGIRIHDRIGKYEFGSLFRDGKTELVLQNPDEFVE